MTCLSATSLNSDEMYNLIGSSTNTLLVKADFNAGRVLVTDFSAVVSGTTKGAKMVSSLSGYYFGISYNSNYG